MTMARDHIAVRDLMELLSYAPDTGLLVWKDRSADKFPDTPRRKAAQKAWNTKYAGCIAGTPTSKGYFAFHICGKRTMAHRAAWAIHYGEYPNGQIDHIDGDPRNNSIENLRDVTPAINCRNRSYSRRPKHGHLGVAPHRGGWKAYIGSGSPKRMTHLGCFDTREAAIEARKAAESRMGYHDNHGRSANSGENA